MAKIIYYRNKCIGCTSCIEHAPEQWEISDLDGKADLKGSKKKKDNYVLEISYGELSENEEAAKDCPVRIIKILK